MFQAEFSLALTLNIASTLPPWSNFRYFVIAETAIRGVVGNPEVMANILVNGLTGDLPASIYMDD